MIHIPEGRAQDSNDIFKTDAGEIVEGQNATGLIPVIKFQENKSKNKKSSSAYKVIPDVAMYKEADWKSVIGVAKGISLEQAKKIADENPNVTFFFYTKGGSMVLERPNNDFTHFQHGDAVFFSGSPWWGSAPGLADGYIKESGEEKNKLKIK